MRWIDAHREAMVAAADAQEELELDTFERIDMFAAMSRARLKLMFLDLTGCAALYLPSSLGGRAGAIIHAGHPLATQRYSGGHEYGHHVFGHGGQIDKETEPRLSRTELAPEEKLAEAFAAWFLMAPETADTALERLGISCPRTAGDAYALSLRLGTSYKATCVHLPSLKLAKEHETRSWGERVLKSLKMDLTHVPPPGGWRQDVWALSAADAQATLHVRAGDRLLLDLPGWSASEVPSGANTVEEPAADLLSTPKLRVDLAPDMDSGPAQLVVGDASSSLRFELEVERPRRGLYVSPRRVAP